MLLEMPSFRCRNFQIFCLVYCATSLYDRNFGNFVTFFIRNFALISRANFIHFCSVSYILVQYSQYECICCNWCILQNIVLEMRCPVVVINALPDDTVTLWRQVIIIITTTTTTSYLPVICLVAMSVTRYPTASFFSVRSCPTEDTINT
jgi:hypothetical protein